MDRSPELDEDKLVRALLQKTTMQVDSGFEIDLLWLYDHVKFPDNYAVYAAREKRFIVDSALFENVQLQIMQYQQKGYIQEAMEEKLATAMVASCRSSTEPEEAKQDTNCVGHSGNS